METIKIETPYNKENFIRINKIRWKVQTKVNLKKLRNMSFWALPILGLGLLFVSPKDPFNPYLFIGIMFTMVICYNLVKILITRSRYMTQIHDLAIKYDTAKMDCTYEITDDLIKYSDKEKLIELKWSAFSNYATYKNFLFILINDSFAAAYIFENIPTDNDNFEKILEMTKEKLTCKKI
jgi:hypothetical protein